MSAAIDAGMMNMAGNDTPTLPRAVMPLLVTAAALITALFAGRAVQPALNRPLNSLRIDGALTHLSAAQIAAAAALMPRTRIFDADLGTLRNRVEALPWVGHARVSRVWPDTLDIRVWERVPAARWGDNQLLDSEGDAFAPPASDLQPAVIQALPQLSGPVGRETEVMGAFSGLSTALQGSEFAPVGLVLDARGEWRMQTARGIELRLGDGDPLAHVPPLLGTISRTLAAFLDQIEYIDLRYSNGFSVGWINGNDCAAPRAAGADASAPAANKNCASAANRPASSLRAQPDTKAPATKSAAAPAAAHAPSKPTASPSAPNPSSAAAKPKANVVAPAAAKEGKK